MISDKRITKTTVPFVIPAPAGYDATRRIQMETVDLDLFKMLFRAINDGSTRERRLRILEVLKESILPTRASECFRIGIVSGKHIRLLEDMSQEEFDSMDQESFWKAIPIVQKGVAR